MQGRDEHWREKKKAHPNAELGAPGQDMPDRDPSRWVYLIAIIPDFEVLSRRVVFEEKSTFHKDSSMLGSTLASSQRPLYFLLTTSWDGCGQPRLTGWGNWRTFSKGKGMIPQWVKTPMGENWVTVQKFTLSLSVRESHLCGHSPQNVIQQTSLYKDGWF